MTLDHDARRRRPPSLGEAWYWAATREGLITISYPPLPGVTVFVWFLFVVADAVVVFWRWCVFGGVAGGGLPGGCCSLGLLLVTCADVFDVFLLFSSWFEEVGDDD